MTDRSYSSSLREFRHNGRILARGKPLARGKSEKLNDEFMSENQHTFFIEGRKTMKITKKKFYKIAAILIAFVMSAAMFSGMIIAKAADGTADTATIDKSKKGSITVTKYASNDGTANKNDATGTADDATGIADSYNKLAGAKFNLYKVAAADQVIKYYNGINTDAYTIGNAEFSNDNSQVTFNGKVYNATKTGTTNENGVYTFDGLDVGMYILKEIEAPDQVTDLSEPCLISLPMVNTDTSDNNNGWMYDINVFPKNVASTGKLFLNKIDQNDNPLAGVTFELYKYDKTYSNIEEIADNWIPVTETTDNSGATSKLVLKTNESGQLNLDSLPAGLNGTIYKLVETEAPDGYVVNESPIYFKINSGNKAQFLNKETTNVDVVDGYESGDTVTVKLKNEKPSLTKKVKAYDVESYGDTAVYRMDKVITYRISTYVPLTIGELATYEITDTPDGITDKYDSVKVEMSDSESGTYTDVDVTCYTIVKNGNGFKLTLTAENKNTLAGKYIHVTYNAYLNEDAKVDGSDNINTAKLVYSKSTTSNETYDVSDTAVVKTYNYVVTKHKDNLHGDIIPGVEFQLLDTKNGTPLNVVKVNDGTYRLANEADETNVITTLTTNDEGMITIQGLGNGTYYLKETKTIKGYNLLSEPFAFTIDNANAKGDIVNKKGFTLPKTGSMGFILFCVLGLALVAGGAMLIFGGKRTKKIR